jgi:hypothetical protein
VPNIFILLDVLEKGGDQLTMDYFENLDNGFSNKYKKILKIYKKNFVDIFFYL